MRVDGLGPMYFVSLPRLTFISCHKMTGKTVELLHDNDTIQHFECGIRSGLTSINNHFLQEHIPELNNKQDGNIHLTYLDENNFFGSSLCRPLWHSENFPYRTRNLHTRQKHRWNSQVGRSGIIVIFPTGPRMSKRTMQQLNFRLSDFGTLTMSSAFIYS